MFIFQDGNRHLKSQAVEQRKERTRSTSWLTYQEVSRKCHRTFLLSLCLPEPSYIVLPSCKKCWAAVGNWGKGRLNFGEQWSVSAKRLQHSFENLFSISLCLLPKHKNNQTFIQIYVLGTVINALYIYITHLILTAVQWGKYHYYPHFIDGKLRTRAIKKSRNSQDYLGIGTLEKLIKM